MEALRTTANLINQINAGLARAIRWLCLIMVVVTLLVVVLRYGFDVGAIALQESVMYMHGLVFLLGIPYGIAQNTHVRVDIVHGRLSERWRHRIELAGHALFLLPVAGFILVMSLPYVAASWRVLEGSPEVGGIPAIFLLKSLVPIMAALLFLQGISQISRIALKTGRDEEPQMSGTAK